MAKQNHGELARSKIAIARPVERFDTSLLFTFY